MTFNSDNRHYVEALFQAWTHDPKSVDAGWGEYFQSLNGSPSKPLELTPEEPRTTDGVPSLDAAGKERMKRLAKLAIFSELSSDDLSILAELAFDETFEDGQRLFSAGDSSNALYVIVDGTVLIQRDGQVIAELKAGDVVGEMSVIEKRARSADAVATNTLKTIKISGTDFNTLLENRGAIARALLIVLAERLRNTTANQERVDRLIEAYRERGHVMAHINPLCDPPQPPPGLTLAHYGLGDEEMDHVFSSRTIGKRSVRTLRQIIADLQRAYCGSIGVQYMHIDDLDVQEWIRVRMENPETWRHLTRDEQIAVLTHLTQAEVFEQFLHKKFLGAKRFSLEGGESLIPLMELAIEEAAIHGVREIVIGMAHRGRMNVLANIMKKSASLIFREFADADPELYEGRGDVKYHLGHSSDWKAANGKDVHLTLCFNPSHLEFVGPVAMGRVRAKQHRLSDSAREQIMAFVIHGDSAIAGEGVVQEQFNMSQLPGYAIGGTVHVVLNNQIGFTTEPNEARSTQYATEIARMLEIPVFHVNGEDPDAVARVIQLAMLFRKTFKRDVVIDMYCYRKYGHNEGDEPMFTQPLMYQNIKSRKTVREAYIQNLLALGQIQPTEVDGITNAAKAKLESELSDARSPDFKYEVASTGAGLWAPYKGGKDEDCPPKKTGIELQSLSDLLSRLATARSDFSVHPKIQRFLDNRQTMARGEKPLDWGAAESLALATLLSAGVHVRISGQDSQRGTFSHRHAVIHDTETNAIHIPLNHLDKNQGELEIFNSPLTETAVLGFDYGYSLDYPDGLVIWEAQFGDFVNVAQVIIDQFISSAEEKWSRLSGLVMLLPHGFEGQGPEHSSARLERFLTLAADDNMQIVNLTTPAQIFHCLRRQVVRAYRKPLIVMSPKSLLRHPEAVSTLDEMANGSFQHIIADEPDIDISNVRRIVLCSGKVYYDLKAHRKTHEHSDVALIRLEQYYPLDNLMMAKVLEPYGSDIPVVWVQEEPLNMGAWPFLHLRFSNSIEGRPLSVIARQSSASPATGSAASHKNEQATLMEKAFLLD